MAASVNGIWPLMADLRLMTNVFSKTAASDKEVYRELRLVRN
jgi:hypothetical protein